MKFRATLSLATAVAVALPAVFSADFAGENWAHYQGDQTSSHYSTLDQINRDNVSQLEVAWTYNSADGPLGRGSDIQTNPLIVDGVLFGVSPDAWVFALNAATGEELWRYDPIGSGGGFRRMRARGLGYWQDGNDKRLLVGARSDLIALDVATGQPIATFGDNGRVDLRVGLDRDPSTVSFNLSTPGVVFDDLYIIGGSVSEGYGAAPGHIRAYNIRSGELAWTFHTIPQPGEPGHETWPADAWERIGGANAWAGLAVDVGRGTVYVPTGSASYDFYGADRLGSNFYANSIVALDARTGGYKWHFQTVHHDLWDKDLPAPPNLVTVTIDGKRIDAVAQGTKTGYIFVLDRDTGEPLFPVDEVPQPGSNMPGEEAWPTQPIPRLPEPITRQHMDYADATNISPEANAFVIEQMHRMRLTTTFLPPSTQTSIVMPGYFGGAEWGGAGVNPETGIMFVNANELPCIQQLVKINNDNDLSPYQQGENVYARSCVACHGLDRKGGTHMGAAPSLIGLGERMSPADVENIIANGRGLMPPMPFVRGDNLSALSTFLLNESDPAGPTAGATGGSEFIYTLTGYDRFNDADGYPAIEPPWGTLNAVDLNTGRIKWKVPLGEFAELTAKGIPPTGTENFGGPVVTAGGIVFIAASADERLRAFDQKTGEILWEGFLPASGFSTPSTYSVDGRQYVVIACGGGRVGRPTSDAYVAFALPPR